MFARSTSRLAWKEYRAQRSLWIALLAGAALLQSLFLAFSLETQKGMPAYPIQVAGVLSACYAVACGALLFAGEREEETDRFLQTLGVHPRSILIGKVGTAILSIVMFVILAFLNGFLVLVIHQGETNLLHYNDPDELVQVYTLAIPMGFVSAMLASLLFHRVMAALIGGVFLLLLTSGISHSFFRSSDRFWDIVMGCLYFSIGLALVPAWLRGGPRWQLLSAASAGDRLIAGKLRFLDRFLHFSALRPGPGNRQFAVVFWKELRAAIPVILVGMICLSGLIPASLDPSTIQQTTWRSMWVGFSAMGAVCFVCGLGLMVYAGDNRLKVVRFLTERGASPALVWLSKQAIWLPLLIVFCLGTVVLMALSRMITTHTIAPFGDREVEILSSTQIFIFFLAGAMTCYSAVQLLSMWFTRTLLAASLSVVLCLLISGWGMLLFLFKIPFELALWPLILCWIAASFFTIEGWMNGTRSWKRVGIQAAWGLLPVLFVLVSAATWRVVEIPPVHVNWQAAERRLAVFDPEWTANWKTLNEIILPRSELFEETQQLLTEISHRIEGGHPPDLDPRLRLSWSTFSNIRDNIELKLLTGESSDREREPESLDALWNSLKIQRNIPLYLAEQALDPWLYSIWSYTLLRADGNTREWAQDPRQTAESLDRLIQRQKIVPFFNNKGASVIRRQMYENKGWGAEWAGEFDPQTQIMLHRFPWSLLVTERYRLERLLNWEYELFKSADPEDQNSPMLAQIRNWERTTPLSPNTSMTIQNIAHVFRMNLDSSRATILIALLEKYRIEHGAYPDHLSQLDPDGSLAAGWGISLTEFRYEPHGLPQMIAVSSDYVLPAGQPVLFRDELLTPSIDGIIPAATQSRLEQQSEDAALLQKLREGLVLWTKVNAQQRYYRIHGDAPEVIRFIQHPAEKSDRIRFIQFGQANPDRKLAE